MSLYMIRNSKQEKPNIEIINGDRQPLGVHYRETPFSMTKINYEEGDKFYLLSDGIIDQFDELKALKYEKKRLRNFLEHKSGLPMAIQKLEFSRQMISWKGGSGQIDDQLLVGLMI